MNIYIGTYTKGSESRGIYRCGFDVETGEITAAVPAGEAANPSFLARDPEAQLIYSVSEGDRAEVVSFGILADGSLEEVDRVATGGSSACHVAVSAKLRAVFAANYGDGSVMSCPCGADGVFDGPPRTVRHSGSGADPSRQKGPHAHSVNIDPAGGALLVADLGTDSIVVYDISGDRGALSEITAARGTAIPGSGPRHMVFHPGGRVVYCVNELTSTVTRYTYIPGEKLEAVQTVPGLPSDFDGVSYAADVHIHPAGTFLYTSNRGHDSIAVFRIEADSSLTPVGHASTRGKNPRNFALVGDGTYLLAANQDGGNVVVFRIGNDGIPVATGGEIPVPMPVCLLPGF